VAGYILARPQLSELSARDFQRGSRTMRAMDRHEVETVGAKLGSLGWLEPAAAARREDAAPRWAVNPAVHAVFADRARIEAKERQQTRDRIVSVLGADGHD
jgi:hypothetical protein